MAARLAMTVLAALAGAACSPQGDDVAQDGPKGNPSARQPPPLVDTCAVARRPERFDGQRVRLRAIVIQEIEFAYLTAPNCMWRRWDGKIGVDDSGGPGVSDVGFLVMEARRRSTDTRALGAEAEFEGIVHARPFQAPVNDIGPVPRYLAMFEVEKVDHARLVEMAGISQAR
jgi:hypothetical protein